MSKQISIGDFLTMKETRLAVRIFKSKPANLHRELLERVIRPNMAEINRKLGQENDADYLAYAVEYALTEATRWPEPKSPTTT